MFRDSKTVRLLIVTMSIAAWLVTTNHCVLGAAHLAGKASGCPMHVHNQSAPQPEKGNGCGDLPCCKNLRTTNPVTAQLVAKPLWLGAFQPFVIVVVAPVEASSHQLSRILDNGPPGENTFAESVLQRSLLAHAPPVSLS